MSRGTAKVILALSIVAMTIAVFGLLMARQVSMIFLVILVWLVIFSILSRFLRCPSCGRYPGREIFGIEYCPYCGEWLG